MSSSTKKKKGKKSQKINPAGRGQSQPKQTAKQKQKRETEQKKRLVELHDAKNLNDVDKVYRTNDEAGRELDQKLNKFKSFALKDDAKPTSVQQKEIYLTTLQERFQEQETQFRTIVDSTIQKYISPTIIREFTNSSNKHVRERLLQELMKERNVFDQQTETFNTFNVTEKRKQDFANAQTIEDRQKIIRAMQGLSKTQENEFDRLQPYITAVDENEFKNSTLKHRTELLPTLQKRANIAKIEAIKEDIRKIGNIETDTTSNYDEMTLLANLEEELKRKNEALRTKDIKIHRCDDGFYKVIIDSFDENFLDTPGLNEHYRFLLTDNEKSINDIITKINNTDSCYSIEEGHRSSMDQRKKIIKSMYIITDKKDTKCTIRESVVQQYREQQFSETLGNNIKLYLCLYDIK